MKTKINEQLYCMNLVDKLDSAMAYDYLFVFGGCEERTYRILQLLDEKSIAVKDVIIIDCQNTTYCVPNDSQPDTYRGYESAKFKYTVLKNCIMDPSAFIKSLSTQGICICSGSAVGIDITSMPHPYFFVLLKYLKERILIKCVDVFYTEPNQYIITCEMFGKYKYASSVGELTAEPMPAYTGTRSDKEHMLLVIQMGFEGQLSQFIYDSTSPEKYVVINGFPSYLPKYRDLSIIFNELLEKETCEEIYSASADNPFEMYNVLKLINERFSGYEINIAPLGTKPMALGACVFVLDHPEVKIVYPRPAQYVMQTSKGYSRSWWYKILLNIP
jgi:hypothetical protein